MAGWRRPGRLAGLVALKARQGQGPPRRLVGSPEDDDANTWVRSPSRSPPVTSAWPPLDVSLSFNPPLCIFFVIHPLAFTLVSPRVYLRPSFHLPCLSLPMPLPSISYPYKPSFPRPPSSQSLCHGTQAVVTVDVRTDFFSRSVDSPC
ncbi:hypothetical protein E2C01_052836 [Portunus trituberculatus]|uniref:Uncharacterized protein n=1 Tax=Portunus trituberculatus TaxID=210409 RepID=A0A5B7GMX2_PORTR|nr:hypothetical protein [Portunus trituberculatus]